MKASYRREIDGLRAVAVVPVLLFHADPSWMSGGYVGVDVFFVISGYLITRNIRPAIEENGLPNRDSRSGESYGKIGQRVRSNPGLSPKCDGKLPIRALCRTSDEPRVLVWGDSYVMHLVPGLTTGPASPGVIQATKSNCAPLLGLAQLNHEKGLTTAWAQACLSFNDEVLRIVETTPSISQVFLAARFSYLQEGSLFVRGAGIVASTEAMTHEALAHTIQRIEALERRAILVFPPPRNGTNIGRCLALAKLNGSPLSDCDFSIEDVSSETTFSRRLLASTEHPYTFDLQALICSSTTCSASMGDIFLYRDTGHLTVEGSGLLGTLWQRQLSNKGTRFGSFDL
jgi:hypothetical protein